MMYWQYTACLKSFLVLGTKEYDGSLAQGNDNKVEILQIYNNLQDFVFLR